MFRLNKLTKLVSKRKKIGRGGSRGGTSTKGHKGQRARTSGNVRAAFEGGQMPLSRRLPKRGFNNVRFAKEYVIVALKQLDALFDEGTEITKDLLREKGILSKKRTCFVKILANGEITKKLILHVDACSKKAKEEVEKAGGEVHVEERE